MFPRFGVGFPVRSIEENWHVQYLPIMFKTGDRGGLYKKLREKSTFLKSSGDILFRAGKVVLDKMGRQVALLEVRGLEGFKKDCINQSTLNICKFSRQDANQGIPYLFFILLKKLLLLC